MRSTSADCKTFTTQTFTTPDVHHPQCKIRRSPPQTFTTPHSKMRHPSTIQNVPAVQTTLHQGSRGQSKQWSGVHFSLDVLLS